MTMLQALILGLIQGITEFLPVSSSGHLALVQSIMSGFEQPGLLFDTMLHLATLMAVMVYFRQKIIILIKSFLGLFLFKYKVLYFQNKHFLWGVVIATIPTGIIGFMLKDFAESLFEKPVVVGYMLILTSLMLMVSDRFQPRGKINPVNAIFIGIIQGLAVFPGISRSGSTIFASLAVGVNREEAAEFSFLISVPAILGATLLQIGHIATIDTAGLQSYAVGMLAAFIAGLFAIGAMMEIVKKAKLKYFAIYCLIIGIGAVLFL